MRPAKRITTLPRLEVDEARDLRQYLMARRISFDEAPRHSAQHRRQGNGIEAGRADFVLSLGGSDYSRQFAIELKRVDGGEVSKAQVEWLREFRRRGGRTAICFGVDEAIEQLTAWGFP